MTQQPPPYLRQSLSSSDNWVFLSPHLDDAVLSCGALIQSQACSRRIAVLTLFSEGSPAPHTRAARSFLRQCSAQDAESLFRARREEDAAVLAGLGVEFRHLGGTDALFRRRHGAPARLGKALPELVHRYPTYRFDIALGRISKGDAAIISALEDRVRQYVEEFDASLVFCPVGVGRHVDHLITRTVGEACRVRRVFYSDFPYNQTQQPDQAFLENRNLTEGHWQEGINLKPQHVRQYATQARALFPGDSIPVAPEIYFS